MAIAARLAWPVSGEAFRLLSFKRKLYGFITTRCGNGWVEAAIEKDRLPEELDEVGADLPGQRARLILLVAVVLGQSTPFDFDQLVDNELFSYFADDRGSDTVLPDQHDGLQAMRETLQ